MKNLIIYALLLFSSIVSAKENIKFYVSQPPGGFVDTFARKIQKVAIESHNTNITVINKPGGEGVLATREFLNDRTGNSMLIGGTFIALKAAESDSNYEAYKSLIPIVNGVEIPLFFVVDKKSNFASWNDVLNELRKRPVTIGVSSGAQRIIVESLFSSLPNATIVPFNGDAQLTLAILNGTVEVGNVTSLTAGVHIRNSTMRGLASTYKNNLMVPIIKDVKINLLNSGFFVNSSTPATKREEYISLITTILNSNEMTEFYKQNNVFLPDDTSGNSLDRHMSFVYQLITKK